MKQLTFALFTILMASTTNVSAWPFYASVNGGISRMKDFCASPATSFDCKNISSAFSIDGGYHLNESLAFELGYGSYGSVTTSGIFVGTPLTVTDNLSGIRLFATASYSFSKYIEGIVKGGIARNTLTQVSSIATGGDIPAYTVNTISPAYGFGVRYNADKYYGFQLQYESLGKLGDDTTTVDSLSILSIGFFYNFGGSAPVRNAPPVRSNRAETQPPAVVPQTPIAYMPAQRVVIFMQGAAPTDKQALTAAIGGACQCTPVFEKLHSSTGLIYRISPGQGITLSAFRRNLLGMPSTLGVKDVMQIQ